MLFCLCFIQSGNTFYSSSLYLGYFVNPFIFMMLRRGNSAGVNLPCHHAALGLTLAVGLCTVYIYNFKTIPCLYRSILNLVEYGCSVVEHGTQERKVGDLKPTFAVLGP